LKKEKSVKRMERKKELVPVINSKYKTGSEQELFSTTLKAYNGFCVIRYTIFFELVTEP